MNMYHNSFRTFVNWFTNYLKLSKQGDKPKDDKDNAKYSKKITDYLKENTNFLFFKYNYYGKPYDNETIDSWSEYLRKNRGVRDWIAPDGHPGKESHKWLSTYIYDYIKRGFKNA